MTVEAHQSMRAPSNDRPILDEAKKKAIIGVVGSAAAAAVSFGIITPEAADSANSVVITIMGAIVTALPLVTSVLHALGIVKGAERRTTPVDSPVDASGNTLVPLAALDLDTAAGQPAHHNESLIDSDLDTTGIPDTNLDPVEPDPDTVSSATARLTDDDQEAPAGRHRGVPVNSEDTTIGQTGEC